MGRLQRSLTVAGDKMAAAGRKMTMRLTLPMAALSGVALRASLTTIDAQAKLAQSLGTTTESMQVMTRAAELAGVGMSGLEQLSKDLTRRLSQAAEGGGPAADTLKRLGLNAQELMALPLDQRISQINAAIMEFVPAAERAAVAGKLFGEEGSIAAMRLDPATIARAAAELERFGVTVTDIEADKIEEANDAISALALVTTGLANQLTVALAPTLKSIAEGIANVGEWFSKLSPQAQKFVGITAALAAGIGPLTVALGLVVTALGALASPIALTIAGIAALGAAVAAIIIHWDDITAAIGRFVDAVLGLGPMIWNALKDMATQALESAKEIGRQLIAGIKAGIAEKWDEFKAGLMARFDGLVSDVKSFFGIQSPSRVFMEIGQFLMEGAAIGIANGSEQVSDAARAAGDAIVSGFGQARNLSSLDTVRGKIDSIADSIGVAIFQGNSLRETLANILSSVGSDLLSTGISSLLGEIIPGYATGTNFAPGGLAVVGEQGRELVNLPRGSQVFSNRQTERMLGGGAPTVNNYIDARGAQLGVGEEIRRVLQSETPTIVRASVAAVADARRRGQPV